MSVHESAGSPAERVGVIVPVTVGRSRIRLHLNGHRTALNEVLEELSHLSCLAEDEATLLETLSPVLYVNDVVLADVLDARGPVAPAMPLVDLLRWAAASRTSRRAFAIMEVAFADASDDDLVRLVRSADFPWVRDLVESVLADLDRPEAVARRAIAELVPAHVARLLIDPAPDNRCAVG